MTSAQNAVEWLNGRAASKRGTCRTWQDSARSQRRRGNLGGAPDPSWETHRVMQLCVAAHGPAIVHQASCTTSSRWNSGKGKVRLDGPSSDSASCSLAVADVARRASCAPTIQHRRPDRSGLACARSLLSPCHANPRAFFGSPPVSLQCSLCIQYEFVWLVIS